MTGNWLLTLVVSFPTVPLLTQKSWNGLSFPSVVYFVHILVLCWEELWLFFWFVKFIITTNTLFYTGLQRAGVAVLFSCRTSHTFTLNSHENHERGEEHISTLTSNCSMNLQMRFMSTVEPPNKGHIGTSHFVLYRVTQHTLFDAQLWKGSDINTEWVDGQ